jgi:enoyl-CoA hydratase/carnithine racemase
MSRVELGTKYLEAEVVDRVFRVRINRPQKKNSTTQDMYRGLKRAAILADGDPEVDSMFVTGTGDVFGVGGDMSGESEDPDGLAMEFDPSDHFPFRHFGRCRKLVVAAVNGLCQAGGLNLVLFSDVVIASDQARFRAPELLRGVPECWMSVRLAQSIGLARARYLLYTATEISAQEAADWGLVARVFPHAEFEERVEQTLQQVALTGPKARETVKREIARQLPEPDMNIFREALLSPEMVEGMKAFLEKRKPEWPRG